MHGQNMSKGKTCVVKLKKKVNMIPKEKTRS